jgi:hypothetical protein
VVHPKTHQNVHSVLKTLAYTQEENGNAFFCWKIDYSVSKMCILDAPPIRRFGLLISKLIYRNLTANLF